jgi:hypothetical protein
MTADDDDFDLTVHDEDRPTDALDTECLGHYPTLDEYLRVAVDTLVLPEGEWLLDCLDLARVRGAFEAGGVYRLRVAGGRVLRDRLRPGA